MIQEQGEKIERTVKEMENLKETVLNQKLQYPPAPQDLPQTYAAVTARNGRPDRAALHSLVVSLKDPIGTSEEVLEEVRKAVNAKDGWVTVERVRKVKDQKVIVQCKTKEDREKVKERLTGAKDTLQFEEAKNQDPMVVLKGVLVRHSDDDVIMALKNQNRELFQDLEEQQGRAEVRFRKKARNPLTAHVVLRVSPKLYERLTTRAYAHIDLQKVKVEDQSPLVQCSTCLGYGHGKRFCTETELKCSHCGGLHMRAKCPDWLAAATPSCCNCTASKMENVEHNAFSAECPVRKKWEALARAKVAYC